MRNKYLCSQICCLHLSICISLCHPIHSNYNPREFHDEMGSFENKMLCKWNLV